MNRSTYAAKVLPKLNKQSQHVFQMPDSLTTTVRCANQKYHQQNARQIKYKRDFYRMLEKQIQHVLQVQILFHLNSVLQVGLNMYLTTPKN